MWRWWCADVRLVSTVDARDVFCRRSCEDVEMLVPPIDEERGTNNYTRGLKRFAAVDLRQIGPVCNI